MCRTLQSGEQRQRAWFALNESGVAFVAVMVFVVIVLISVMAVMALGGQDAVLAARDHNASQAFYCAEAGAQRGAAWLASQSVLPTTQVTPFGDTPEPFADGLYQVTVEPDYSTDRTFFTVTSHATVRGRSKGLEVDLTPTAFTDYLYYTNRDVGPGSIAYFKTGDVVDGPVHIGDELAIWGSPVFTGKVECTYNTILYHNNFGPVHRQTLSNLPYDDPEFQEGCRLGVATHPWMAQEVLNTMRGLSDIVVASQDIWFGRDDGSGPMLGYVSFSKVDKNVWTDVLLSSFNGIIYVNGDCFVQGIIDGQATICSNGNIGIVDDLIYADSDTNGPRQGCDDMLGLIASSMAQIKDNAPNNDDCVVHAHIIAINNLASLVENYSTGTPRGTLTVYGGLAQDKWAPVGTGYFDAYGEFQVLTGYEKDFHYDWRLRTMLPPGYEHIIFTGGEFEQLAWRETEAVDLGGG